MSPVMHLLAHRADSCISEVQDIMAIPINTTLSEEEVSSGHLAWLCMQVDGGKDAGESSTGEVMTTWCCIQQQSTTGAVMGEPKLSPRGEASCGTVGVRD